jgi:CheY-like chemotaxis protein
MNRVHLKALERASVLQGGMPELAARLGVPVTTLILMMDGTIALPAELFVKVVDIIISADLAAMRDPLVIVVEDDPATAYSFSRLIAQLGYRVATAKTGASALEQIRALQPLVAFVDLRLPDIEGSQIAEVVRAENLNTRVIAVTAYGASATDRERSLAVGFENHFAKPLDLATAETVLPKRASQG